MDSSCSEAGCAEASLTSIDGRPYCRAHYLAHCYRRLDEIAQIVGGKHYELTQDQADTLGQFLQDCMRRSADFASSQHSPSNLEKA